MKYIISLMLVLTLSACWMGCGPRYRTIESYDSADPQWKQKAAKSLERGLNPQKTSDFIGPALSDEQWRELALDGNAQAQSQQCSSHGLKADVPADYYEKIVVWCRTDAQAGDVAAMRLVGNLYASGNAGYPQNHEEAYFWHAARITDSHVPVDERDAVAKQLSPAQIDAVNRRVADWKKSLCAKKTFTRRESVLQGWHCGNVAQ